MKRTRLWLLGLALCCAPADRADTLYTFSMDTAPLVGNGLFTLDFQLLDGSGLPMDLNNNTVALSGFGFGAGGSASGGGTATGGASGALALGVTLSDSSFFNEYYESFSPGALLTFTIDTTNVADPGGTPDLFTVAILDSNGFELPTTGPASEFLDVSLAGGASPQVSVFGSAPGSVYALSAPEVQVESPAAAPEPPPVWGVLGVLVLLWIGRWRSGRSRRRHGPVTSGPLG